MIAPPPPPPFAFSPPPPPPPPVVERPTAPVSTVELLPCPTCGTRFTIPAEDVGAQVECSQCKTVFTGHVAGRVPTVVTPIDTPPPPAPPAPAGEDVDIAPCPKCRAELTVAVADLGTDVECPFYQTVYTAVRPPPRGGTLLAKSVRRTVATPVPPPPADDPPKKPYEFKAKKKSSPFLDGDEDDDDDRPRKKSRRRRDRDDDDDDEDDRPRKKRRPSRGLRDSRYRSYSNHDGVLLLVISIVNFFVNGFGSCCCYIGYFLALPLNIYVLIKASHSIGEIKKGTMDPSGRVLLEVARVLAILQILLFLVWVVLWLTGMIVTANSFTPPLEREPEMREFDDRNNFPIDD